MMSKKPIFRWTVGSPIRQGLEILEESIVRMFEIYSKDKFDWVVCYNGLNREELAFLKHVVANFPIQIMSQDWANCPIPDFCRSPRKMDGSIEVNGKNCGGTLWKVCPARLRLDVHEIIMDNDIVFMKPLPQIEEFLQDNKCLILEEPVRFYGVYDKLFDYGENLNSGLMGLPPHFDFEAEIRKHWEQQGKHSNHSQADEQGLLTYTLKMHPNIRIKKSFVKEILAKSPPEEVKGDEFAIHFTQANRSPNHRCWLRYLEMTRSNIGMI